MNHVTLVGRLTQDPRVAKTSSGTPYARFTVAISRPFRVTSGQNLTDFVPVVVWSHSANFAENYLHKGNLVSVVGSIQTGSYTNREGQRIYTVEVNGSELKSLETRSSNNYNNNNNYQQSETASQPLKANNPQASAKKAVPETSFFEEEEDQIDWDFDDLD